MLDVSGLNYQIDKDLGFILEAEDKTIDEMAKEIGISRTTFYEILKGGIPNESTCEKVYSYVYRVGYRLNAVKVELLKEISEDPILFHGSKSGLTIIREDGSRKACDFGAGFYLGESYEQALSFIYGEKNPSIYSFKANLEGLKVLRMDVSLEWMLSICYFRGSLREYEKSKMVQKAIEGINDCDLIIAPIADNRMFYIMTLFAEGEINADVALHSLAASSLGLQYVFKTSKALEGLTPIEKYYLSEEEKADWQLSLKERSKEIETKLKLSKRQFKNGLFIEEMLK